MNVIEKFAELDKPKKPRDDTSAEVMTKKEIKKEAKYIRTLGSVRVAAEAQRLFNPTLPPTKPKAPTAAQLDVGSAAAMDTTGNWGTAAK